MDLTEFYTKKIDIMEAEIKTNQHVITVLQERVADQCSQIDVLTKVVRTSRNHFKEVEKADFETLKQQVKEYEEKVSNFQLDES